ncbi:hypothetical protein LWI29_021779 [Acer saccharum]|uniref:Uncharacterized protein n=1 Tax=Acer saccharum TaxID=4024 RepID=A0AA39S8J2_ACESA|nr:hypothetical protein LWI29_021779 [Acer saccharum]
MKRKYRDDEMGTQSSLKKYLFHRRQEAERQRDLDCPVSWKPLPNAISSPSSIPKNHKDSTLGGPPYSLPFFFYSETLIVGYFSLWIAPSIRSV